ncbi:MAG: exodeoxyribonuclease VII large subunit [Ignavibacteriae bacterium]|nr:exodeoxyribonuclease VII large subunit [Ignavibacteriota bacterium]
MNTIHEKKVLSVSEITARVKLMLESSFPQVWIQGEISNAKLHTSGHFYFTLKDEGAQISGIMWRSRVANLPFTPEDGMKVIARGSVTVYPPRGNYQLDCVQLQPMGIGELQLAFERLKKKLDEEGLFDPEHKKPIPEYPEHIGVITSVTGAALQDIRSVLSWRLPTLEVIVYPVHVQGVGAAEEIAEAIRDMNRFGGVDVLIVGRGGGSFEDLWAFNEEAVARAIYDSKIPVISAVGHEIDFSIADFVADLRAPTPSAAAELVVRDRSELLDILRNLWYTMQQNLEDRVHGLRERIENLVSSYSFNKPKDLLRQSAQRVDELERSLARSFVHLYKLAAGNHQGIHQRLVSLNPGRVLQRGYAIVRKDGQIMTSSHMLKEGDTAAIQFHDGEVPARVEK